TLAAGFLLARLFALERAYGALAGAGTAVCGASATLATSIVLPDYKGKETDIVFVVVAVNALSTLAMVVYPPFCTWLGFDAQITGIMLGGRSMMSPRGLAPDTRYRRRREIPPSMSSCFAWFSCFRLFWRLAGWLLRGT